MKAKILFMLLVVQFTIAQQRTCGMEAQMERLMANPIERQNYLEMRAKFEVELTKINNTAGRLATPVATTYIPVAIHYPSTLSTASSTLKTCLRTLAQNQVNILNADYNRANADYLLWTGGASANYPGIVAGVMNVQFVIAIQNHPIGTNLEDGDMAVTFGTDFLSNADYDATWRGYFNLVVRDIAGNILGYSPLGGSLNDGATVVIDDNAFGSGAGCTGYVPNAPYNLGRTLTHELGHFFNLNHTFLSADNTARDCAPADQDGISDTPKCPAATYGCPTVGSRLSCETLPSLTMNYMDYTNDNCMYMFTAGQAARMQAWYNTIMGNVKSNVLSNSTLPNEFSVTPNPNNGTFTINLKEVLNNYTVQVFDATGRLVFGKEFNQMQNVQQNVSIHKPQSGLYFVTVTSDNAILTRKILVQ